MLKGSIQNQKLLIYILLLIEIHFPVHFFVFENLQFRALLLQKYRHSLLPYT
jgi:hypothetical protein